jgi:biopolymer transport protein ExbD
MAIQVNSPDEEDEVNSTINTTPLVDVMLVLLIIFLITVPVVIKSVRVALPQATNIPTVTKPENIVIAVDTDENYYWNDARIESNDVLLAKLRQVAVMRPQPEVHIRADRNVRFEAIGRLIVFLQRSAILKVGFITEPDRPGGG